MQRRLVRWVFFILYVGNSDSHAKSLSIYSVPGQGVTLTPFYDLMCTRLYPGLSAQFAFAIGGEFRPGAMTADNLALMARQLGMQPRFLAQQKREMADRLHGTMSQAVQAVAPALSPSALTLAERLECFISSSAKKQAARLTASTQPSPHIRADNAVTGAAQWLVYGYDESATGLGIAATHSQCYLYLPRRTAGA